MSVTGAATGAAVTDMAPHPLWLHPAVDLHLVAAPGDVARARGACPAASVRHARPLVEDAYLTLPPRAEARERTGLDGPGPWVLVDHSAWNVPPAHELVDPLLARSDARVVVSAAGFQDDSDARALRRRYASTSRVEVRDDEEEKPLLSAACDLLVTTVASTTAFAALAAGTPTVLFHALPGHGVASAEAAERDGVALWARTEEELGRIVADGARGLDVAAARARVLDAPTVAEQVLALAAA